MYDQIDLDHEFKAGFWLGIITGGIGMLILCLIAGYFVP